jgi:hypothetical protein
MGAGYEYIWEINDSDTLESKMATDPELFGMPAAMRNGSPNVTKPSPVLLDGF